jgi:O-acetyl-ADP-ribose deacetylase (regulator of RNase III)
MSVEIASGDLLKRDDVDAIVNTVNCVGVMGKGIALQFRRKFTKNYDAYEAACKRGEVKIGKMFAFDNGAMVQPHYVINFPTKKHWRQPSKLEYISSGLEDFIAVAQQLGIKSVAMPPLGCGAGGLDWADVKPLIEAAAARVPELRIVLFPPNGAPAATEMETRTAKPKMTPGRAAMIKVLEAYKELDYGLSQIEVQKLTYFLQSAGQKLRMNFIKHTFGPYAQELKHVLSHMEGHYIVGVGDGVVQSEISPTKGALDEAEAFLREAGDIELNARVDRITNLIEGFQSPYGMELLATVHWVNHDPDTLASTLDEAVLAVHSWNERKRDIMKRSHIEAAWNRLREDGWLRQPQVGDRLL